jgi:hypothetical protein
VAAARRDRARAGAGGGREPEIRKPRPELIGEVRKV